MSQGEEQPLVPATTEWLLADGLGGFAMGTPSGIRTRRYHGFLTVASPWDERRFALVGDLEVWIDAGGQRVELSTHRYAAGAGDVIHPRGFERIAHFTAEPWPTWTFAVGEGLRVAFQLLAVRGRAAMVAQWRLMTEEGHEDASVTLHVRPLLAARDFHAQHHENPHFAFEPDTPAAGVWRWHPYEGIPPIVIHANGEYRHAPEWYRGFRYAEERERGLDDVEDLAAPGVFEWTLTGGAPAELMLTTSEEWLGYWAAGDFLHICRALRESERARIAAFRTRLHHAADAYLVTRGARHTIIAGYPWFSDWGRDTFIALRGLCLATGRTEDAQRVLLSWIDAMDEGMLPNYFPTGGAPEYNSVDASLWYVVAAQAFLDEAARRGRWIDPSVGRRLTDASQEILERYEGGTRFGIHMDDDGLLAAGVAATADAPATNLTWMDARVGGVPVTPRVGKPVEIQALWASALAAGSRWSERWSDLADRVHESFHTRFWNAGRGCCHDVVDVDHVPGAVDSRVRPNQILAVGGLPVMLLDPERARSVVDVVERELWTPLGPRTLAPDEPGYAPRCTGSPGERDGAYHQGTVWPWLAGAFVEAWVRTREGRSEWEAGRRKASKAEAGLWAQARQRFLKGFARHFDEAGVGHVSEIADGEPPHTPRGCPFQAWSVGEVLRVLEAGK